jgi:hypothetical protein
LDETEIQIVRQHPESSWIAYEEKSISSDGPGKTAKSNLSTPISAMIVLVKLSSL